MYNHKEIEKKWQNYWEENKTFKTKNNSEKPKYYTLDMFPFPSGAGLHVGHPEWMTANDIVARYKNAKWYNVLHPMGWDAFWLPAENYAIKTWTHPKITTKENIDNFRKQIKALWFSYDWDREVDTTDPKYYKWTQWIFLKLFEKGLAYEQDLPINYCPSCKTGLANEEVLNNFTCERCHSKVEKKQIRQWVLAITKYADRLEKDVDKLDWPEGIKDMQKNWIGRSEGCEFEMKVCTKDSESSSEWQCIGSIRVYTTRIDTVFGMTYAVLAPDHKSVMDFITPEQKEACLSYIDEANKKSDQDRTQDDKEKTWVFTGSYVINPFNWEKVPLWIWDYVLGNYGTWAVMAVPAHDERDFEFAKKYGLEIKQSVAEKILWFWPKSSHPQKDKKEIYKNWITALLLNENEEKLLMLDYPNDWTALVTWWVENNDSFEDTLYREIKEETWYTDTEIITELNTHYQEYYHEFKDINWYWINKVYVVKLKSGKKEEISSEELNKHKPVWISINDYEKEIYFENHKRFIKDYLTWNYGKAFTDYWVLVNSWAFDSLSSEEAKIKLVEFAEKEWFWTKKVNYKLRDWLFSRQRYWWEPIPLIHIENSDFEKLPREKSENAWIKDSDILMIWDKEFSKVYDGIYGKIVCDYRLPLELPEVEDFAPAWDGQSPLAKVDSFVNVKLADNLSWKRETNTMPQWWGSCWYYLRYMDNENDEVLVNPEVEKYWWQVDSYVWWAEHAVLHLLYARFWHKFLYDIWVVSYDEPFYRLRNQGLILAHAYQKNDWWLIANDLVEEKDGKYFEISSWQEVNKIVSKMSKSLKNVINPDDIVEEYGADSLRLYEMYMAEFKDSAPWDTKGIIWVRRFIEKSERLFTAEAKISSEEDLFTMKLLHKTIKKVEEDIENYKFNTAISSLMILVNNWLPKDKETQREWRKSFLVILNPFAPHLAEELWERIHCHPELDSGSIENKNEKLKKDSESSSEWHNSIFFAEWPVYDEAMTIDDTITIGVQVLGKLRWTIEINKDEDKEVVLEKAKKNEDVKKWLEWKDIVKEIYVPWKIVNIVIK